MWPWISEWWGDTGEMSASARESGLPVLLTAEDRGCKEKKTCVTVCVSVYFAACVLRRVLLWAEASDWKWWRRRVCLQGRPLHVALARCELYAYSNVTMVKINKYKCSSTQRAASSGSGYIRKNAQHGSISKSFMQVLSLWCPYRREQLTKQKNKIGINTVIKKEIVKIITCVRSYSSVKDLRVILLTVPEWI